MQKIKNILIYFFTNHKFINQVVYGTDWELNGKALEKNALFPLVNIEHRDTRINGRNVDYSFLITIYDLVAIDDEMEDFIINNCQLIMEDLFSYLYNRNDILFNRATTATPFYDDLAVRSTGITFGIVVGDLRPENACNVPLLAN